MMKVTLERNHLLKSLGHVHRVVERRNTYPILSNVLLAAEDAKLQLRATDLDLEVTESAAASVEVAGTTTVPAYTFYEIVRKLADGAEVVLETGGDADQMAIVSGRSRFSLACLSPDGFPDLKSGEFTHSFVMKAEALRELIERTQFAISSEETRYYLNGIFMHTVSSGDGPEMLRAVATDGHRLARAETEAPQGASGMPAIIVPRKTVGEMLKLLEDADAEVAIELSDTKIRFEVGGVVLLSKLIEGTFPDYERVIPSGNDKKLVVDTGTFRQAVDRVSTIASERGGRAVKLALAPGLLELTVTNPDHGTAREELPVEYEADAFEIGFNAKYLMDIADQIHADSATFLFADAGSPTLIRTEDEPNALYVLMPMRV
jgi:DNA polymerase III subunit beta